MSVEPKQRIIDEARRLGFDAVGVARADMPLGPDFERYEAFIDGGMQGEMSWLARVPEARRRLDGEHILRGAKSVVCLAQRYGRSAADEALDPPLAKAIARYARGRDYHNGLRKKLRKLAKLVRSFGTPAVPVQARPLCDREPVLERAWAARAGLGFVGKNGLIIVPGVGSLVLLGEVVTTLELEPDPAIPERCGACTRCLDVCPTDAFVRPFVLDPRRCVAYLTIEHREAIPSNLREDIGAHLFGCDDCQTSCPFNTRSRAPTPELSAPNARARREAGQGASASSRRRDPRFDADLRWDGASLADLLALDDGGFRKLREGSPVGRATRVGLARNAAVVMGNSGDIRHMEALARARESHDSAIVRDAADWAISRIEQRIEQIEQIEDADRPCCS